MQQLWDLCDTVFRLRMSVATVLAGVGSALLAIFFAAFSQLLVVAASEKPNAWCWSVSLVLAIAFLVGAVLSWVIAYEMLEIATRVGRYYQDEVRDRWLRKEE